MTKFICPGCQSAIVVPAMLTRDLVCCGLCGYLWETESGRQIVALKDEPFTRSGYFTKSSDFRRRGTP